MGVPASLSSVPDVAPYIQYVAANGQTVYPYPFPITEDSDMVVVINGTTQSTDATYSVSGVGNSTGGYITLNAGSSTGDIVTLYRDIPIERISQISQNSGFSSQVFNNEFNNFYLIAQQLQAAIAQCLQIPNTNNPTPTTLLTPSAYANKYLSFDANGNPQPALLTANGTLTGAAVAGLLSVYTASAITPDRIRTPAEIAAGVTPTNYAYYEGDIRRYGALLIASDNSTAVTNGLAVSAAGGSACFVPGGTWGCTNDISVTGSASMYGAGQLSELYFTGCNGLSFSPQGAYAGSRFIRDLSLIGSSATTSSYAAISIAMTSGRLSGIKFSNLTIQNWNIAVDLESTVSGVGGLWNSVFEDCWLSNNYQGYRFNGEAIGVQIVRGFADAGSNMTGSGTRYGVFTGLNGSTNDVQALRVTGFGTYNYDVCISLNYTTEAVIEHCDLSEFNVYGVELTTIVGGPTVIRDSWIQATSTAVSPVAIQIDDLGSATYDKVLVDNNRLSGNAATSSVGVYCGENHNGIVLTNNSIGTAGLPFVYGIAGISNAAASPNLVAKFNTIYSTTADIAVGTAAVDCEIGPNTNLNGSSARLVCPTSPAGMRYIAPGMRGTATFGAATSVAVAFSVDMPNATYNVALGGNAGGYAWPVDKATTGFAIDCSASNSNPVDWQISYG